MAQAIEEKDGLKIRDDPEKSNSVDARDIYTKKNYDSFVGASGTATGKDQLFAAQGMSGKVIEVQRYYEQRLDNQPDKVFENTAAKLAKIVAEEAAQDPGHARRNRAGHR